MLAVIEQEPPVNLVITAASIPEIAHR